MKLESALYQGRVRHRRFAPRTHRLSYPLFMLYVDLEEIEEVFSGSWLWSADRPALAWLRRGDYFGDADRPWAETVRDTVFEHCGRRPEGSVRLLTNPRTLGLRMNPVSFYYCFDAGGELEAVVAEITNTPWDERHLYVVHRDEVERAIPAKRGGEGRPSAWRTSFEKAFHVSPFLPMDMHYRWILAPPDERLVFHMENHRGGRKVLDATLALRREEITPASLRAVLFRHPFQTARILFWIYLHAAVLKLKNVRFHTHPKHLRRNPS